MYRRLVVAGFLVASSRLLAAQENAFLIPSDREATAQVAKIVANAEASGLPTAPIASIVGKGVVFRSKPDRIVAAAGAVAARMEVAREALGPNPTAAEIAAGADALAEKATPDALRAVKRAGAGRTVEAPLGVLAQLLADPNKVPLPRATAIVTELVRKHATPAQLAVLGNEVTADANQGTSALASLDVRAQGLIAVLAAPGGSAAVGDALTVSAPGVVPPGLSSSGAPRANPPKPPKRP
jgi:hypothetical protein